MRLLTRYTLRQIWLPMLLASVVVSFVMIAGAIRAQLRQLLDDAPIAQVTAFDMSRIAFYALPTLVGYIFPITFLLAIMLAFGRMAQRSELPAMKAAGIPLKRLVFPVIVAGAFLSVLCFWVQDQGQPWAYKRLMQLVRSDMPMRVTLDMLPKGVMHEYGDWRVYIGDKDKQGRLRNIVVLQQTPDGRATAFYADSADLVKEDGQSSLVMHKGYLIPPEKNGKVIRMVFDTLTKTVPALKPRRTSGEHHGMTLAHLWRAQRKLTVDFERMPSLRVAIELHKQRIEISERLSFPLMCLAVSFVAAPIGARSKRSGRSYAFVGGLAIVGVYFVLAKALALPVLLPLRWDIALGQVPNIVLCLLGGVFVWRVDRV